MSQITTGSAKDIPDSPSKTRNRGSIDSTLKLKLSNSPKNMAGSNNILITEEESEELGELNVDNILSSASKSIADSLIKIMTSSRSLTANVPAGTGSSMTKNLKTDSGKMLRAPEGRVSDVKANGAHGTIIENENENDDEKASTPTESDAEKEKKPIVIKFNKYGGILGSKGKKKKNKKKRKGSKASKKEKTPEMLDLKSKKEREAKNKAVFDSESKKTEDSKTKNLTIKADSKVKVNGVVRSGNSLNSSTSEGASYGARTSIEKVLSIESSEETVVEPRVKQNAKPFNVGRQRFGDKISRVPGPGCYTLGIPRREMEFVYSFNGAKKMVPAVEIKCTEENMDRCVICEQQPQGDYWHFGHVEFMCRACMDNISSRHMHPTQRLRILAFRKIRDCSAIHSHEGTKAKILLVDPKQIKRLQVKEAYLTQYYK